ncbi:type 4a pilus biogenesis protein PilO [Desulfosarcina sp. OttesenSCG-928-G17]|nr:type 4a pilus biogenesis protein PilO [Desulfosarcina sp. OttesenSCG-928-G17]
MSQETESSTNNTAGLVFEWLENLSSVQRRLIWSLTMILVMAGFVWVSCLPHCREMEKLKTQLEKEEKTLEIAKQNAQAFDSYKKKLADAKSRFKEVARALPENEEISALLTEISKARESSGLALVLFQPKPEEKKDFYVEIPISIRVIGDYHGMAVFFEEVSRLDRIVHVRDITITPVPASEEKTKDAITLAMTCTAVAYKFAEDLTRAAQNP